MRSPLRPVASRPVAVALGSIALVTLAGCSSGSSSPPAATAQSVLKAAKAAIAKQTGAHLVISVTPSGTGGSETITSDSGVSSGMETIRRGSSTASIRVTPTYGYISGNAAGLASIFGMSAADVKKVGTHWVAFKAGTSQYADLKSSVTISSITSVLPEAKGTKLSTKTENGASVHILSWTTAATSTTPKTALEVTIAATGTPLPTRETSTTSTGSKQSIVLSNWGEKVDVSAPPAASTVSAASITG